MRALENAKSDIIATLTNENKRSMLAAASSGRHKKAVDIIGKKIIKSLKKDDYGNAALLSLGLVDYVKAYEGAQEGFSAAAALGAATGLSVDVIAAWGLQRSM